MYLASKVNTTATNLISSLAHMLVHDMEWHCDSWFSVFSSFFKTIYLSSIITVQSRIQGHNINFFLLVLDNLTSDEEFAVLRDQGVVHQGGKKHKQNFSYRQEK